MKRGGRGGKSGKRMRAGFGCSRREWRGEVSEEKKGRKRERTYRDCSRGWR
jgi:hypothetical protein